MTKADLREQLKQILAVAVPTNFVEPDGEILDPLIDEFLDALMRYADTDGRIRR